MRGPDFETQDVTYSAMPLECPGIDDCITGAANMIMQPKTSKQPIFNFVSKDKHYMPIIVRLDATKEQEMIIKKDNNLSFYTTMLQSAAEHLNMINLALAVAKRKASDGEDVIVYIDSLDLLIKNQNICSGYDLLDIKANTLDIVKKISMSARQLSKVGSLTIVGLYNYSEISYDKEMTSILQDYFAKTHIIKK